MLLSTGRFFQQSVATTAPAQFGTGDWSVADAETGGDITITITTLPSDGGSAITDLEYQIDGGSWVSLSGTTTGAYPVSGLTDDVEVDVAIRAVNAVGNGTASATKAITPTTAADSHFANVILLSHFTGSNGSTTFTDQSSDARTLTAAGNAQIQSNKLELDGTDDRVTIADSADWRLNGDFTHEFFGVEFDNFSSERRFAGQYNSASNQRGWIASVSTAGRLRLALWTAGTSASIVGIIDTANGTIAAGTPYDICFERSGTTVRAYVDGVMIASATTSAVSFDSTTSMSIGGASDAFGATNMLDGRMAAVRMTNGVARYASDGGYSVPNLPLPTA